MTISTGLKFISIQPPVLKSQPFGIIDASNIVWYRTAFTKTFADKTLNLFYTNFTMKLETRLKQFLQL